MPERLPEHQDWADVLPQPSWWAGPGSDNPVRSVLSYTERLARDEAAHVLEAVRSMTPGQRAELAGLLGLPAPRSRFLWLPSDDGFAPPLSPRPADPEPHQPAGTTGRDDEAYACRSEKITPRRPR